LRFLVARFATDLLFRAFFVVAIGRWWKTRRSPATFAPALRLLRARRLAIIAVTKQHQGNAKERRRDRFWRDWIWARHRRAFRARRRRRDRLGYQRRRRSHDGRSNSRRGWPSGILPCGCARGR